MIPIPYKLLSNGNVRRLSDGAEIPPTVDNIDWAAFQQWIAADAKNNIPIPADPVPPVVQIPQLSDVVAALVAAKISIPIKKISP